jgi:hypothetical protein
LLSTLRYETCGLLRPSTCLALLKVIWLFHPVLGSHSVYCHRVSKFDTFERLCPQQSRLGQITSCYMLSL